MHYSSRITFRGKAFITGIRLQPLNDKWKFTSVGAVILNIFVSVYKDLQLDFQTEKYSEVLTVNYSTIFMNMKCLLLW